MPQKTHIPSNWESFLRIEKNKEELFFYLSDCIRLSNVEDEVVISTQAEKVVMAEPINQDYMNALQPCKQEEADTRVLLHVAHCGKNGCRKVAIRTVDTDVVVLSVAHFSALELDELLISFGMGTHFRHIPVHTIVTKLGPMKLKCLMMFHAITGCDTVSSFIGRGKRTAWLAWNACPTVTPVFLELSARPAEVSENALNEN